MNRTLSASARTAACAVVLLGFAVRLQAGNPTPDVDIIPFGSSFRYFQPLTLNQNPINHLAFPDPDFETEWFESDFTEESLSFNDAGAPNADPGTGIATVQWLDGTTPIGYGAIPGFTGGFGTITPTPAAGDRFTMYFRALFNVPAGVTGPFALELLADDGAAFYLDGQILDVSPADAGNDRFNCCVDQAGTPVPQGSIPVYTDRAGTTQPTAGNDSSFTTILLDKTIAPGDHLLAVSLHNESSNASDMGFEMRLFQPGNGRPWNAQSGDWADANNWGVGIPDNRNEFAVFGDVITANRTIWTDVDRSLDGVQFEEPDFSYTITTISGDGSITLLGDNRDASLNVLQGSHEFQLNVSLGRNTDADIAAGSSITFNNRLDLNGNTLTKTGDGDLILGNDIDLGQGTIVVSGGSLAGNGVIAGETIVAGGAIAPAGQTSQASGSAVFAKTLTISGSTFAGAAIATESNSNAVADGTLEASGPSASLGSVSIGQSLVENGSTATASAGANVALLLDLTTETTTIGAAFAFGGSADVNAATANWQAASVTSRSTTVGTAQISGPDVNTARVGDASLTITADNYTVNGALSVANVSVTGPGSADVDSASADINSQTFTSQGLQVGTINSSNAAGQGTVSNAELNINGGDTTINGVTTVGGMNLSASGAAGAIQTATLFFENGTLTVANVPAGFDALRIAPINAFSPAGLLQTSATARFKNVEANLDGSVSIARILVAGADPGSAVQGELRLEDSAWTVNGNVVLGEVAGAASVDSTQATLSLDAGSYLDITGDLQLSDKSELELFIEGLTRPVPGVPGQYGAIDAANAILEGALNLHFNFAGVQLGDSFDLISLVPGGNFTGGFSSTFATGLPFGLTAEPAVAGSNLVATVVAVSPSNCDFSGDGVCNVEDMDLLSVEVAAGTNTPSFDLTGDGLVTVDDMDKFRSDAAAVNGLAGPYLSGDANLDGTVNSSDLNALGQSWQVSEGRMWSTGDFTGDGGTTALDLNEIGQNWQQSAPQAAAQNVAIPSLARGRWHVSRCFWLCLAGLHDEKGATLRLPLLTARAPWEL